MSTWSADPVASRSVLLEATDADHLEAFGRQELFVLALSVSPLALIEPTLLAEIYIRAFSYRETRSDPTLLGASSGIMQLTSNARQDYRSGLHRLERSFDSLVQASVVEAARVLRVLLGVAAHRELPNSTVEPIEFDFIGDRAGVLPDGSIHWDVAVNSGAHPVLGLCKVFDQNVSAVLSDEAQAQALIMSLRGQRAGAAFWRRILRVATACPTLVGIPCRELAWTPNFLGFVELWTEVGEFLGAVFPYLDAPDRERVELRVLALQPHVRDRYLGCIPTSALRTDAAHARLAELNDAGGPPANSPVVSYSSSTTTMTLRMQLQYEGVDCREHDEVLSLCEAMPGLRGPIAGSADLSPLADLLAVLQGDLILPEPLQRRAWQELSHAACGRAQNAAGDSTDLLADVLEACADHDDPVYADSEDYGGSFQSGYFTRTHAASGLLALEAHRPGTVDEQLILQLATDPHPWVRQRLAQALGRLPAGSVDLVRALTQELAENEGESVVVLFLCEALSDMRRRPDLVDLAEQCLARIGGRRELLERRSETRSTSSTDHDLLTRSWRPHEYKLERRSPTVCT